MNGTAIANQRYTMIADILPVLDDKKALIGTIWQCITIEIRLKSLYNIFVMV